MAAAKLQKHSLVELAAAVAQTVSTPWQREREASTDSAQRKGISLSASDPRTM